MEDERSDSCYLGADTGDVYKRQGFMETLKPSAEMLRGFKAVCIGEETRKAAAACGMDCITALIPTMDSLAECMKKDAGNI